MLKINHLKKNYPSFSLDCSLHVAPGCITGLIGQNGSGKSTTFKSVLGLISTDGGQISLFGKDMHELTIADRQKLGVVLSDSGFSGYLTPQDLVPILKNLYPDFDKAFFLTNLEKFGLSGTKKIKEFSTGMKAKLKVLVAISSSASAIDASWRTAWPRYAGFPFTRIYSISSFLCCFHCIFISSDADGNIISNMVSTAEALYFSGTLAGY